MGKQSVAAVRPPMWAIERAGGDSRDEVLHFGRHSIAIADIAGIAPEETRDRFTDGLLLAAMIFFVVAGALAFGVFDGGIRPRFLLATVFLGFLGFMGISELRKVSAQSFFQVRLDLKDAPPVVFASADRAEVDGLLAALVARL